MQNTCRRFCIKYWMNLLFWTSFCANYYPKGQRPSWGQSLLSVSLSAGLLTVKFKGNYEEMAPRMSLKWKRTLPTDVVETDVRRKPLADRAGGRAWVRQTETESDSRVWLARSVMENLTEHGAPIWFGGTQHHLGYDCVRPTGYSLWLQTMIYFKKGLCWMFFLFPCKEHSSWRRQRNASSF